MTFDMQWATYIVATTDASYRKPILGISLAQCQDACRAEEQCQMFEHYRGPEDGGVKCLLFNTTALKTGSAHDTDIGLKSASTVPTTATWVRWNFKQHPGTSVAGDGYDTSFGLTLAQCEERCGRDPQCRMFERYTGVEVTQPKCSLYRSTSPKRSPAHDAHTAIKQ